MLAWICTILLATAPVVAFADSTKNWLRFRGPTAMGVAKDDPRLPDKWGKTVNVCWVTEIPGWGWSSPIVSGKRVFLTTVVSESKYEVPKKGLYLGLGRPEPPKGVHHWIVYCLDLDSGKVLWKREAHRGEPQSPRHPKSTYASETPTSDGERVYALFGDVGLFCYAPDGKALWSHRIEPKPTLFGYGAAASPVVCGDLVIMVYDNQEEPYIAAFDSQTGIVQWRTTRKERSTWATPFVWRNDLRTEIVTSGFERIRSYSLRGEELWELEGPMSNLVIPSPFAACGLVFLTSGYVGDRDRPVYAIRPGAKGEISLGGDPAEHPLVAWYQPKAGPYNTSPIVYDGKYYTLLDRGFMTCHDARTGREIFGKTRFPSGASFTSSPWAYNGKIFCLSENGDTFVVQAGPQFKVIRVNHLDELCMASPAVAQGKLLLRTASRLYCFARAAADQ